MLEDIKTSVEKLISLYEKEKQRADALAEEIDRDFVDTSQFKRMILNKQVSPTIKSTFNEQYRMHPAINDVISQFYENEAVRSYQAQITELNGQIDNLKLSFAFSGAGDTVLAKERIDKLVREIDKCIKLLEKES